MRAHRTHSAELQLAPEPDPAWRTNCHQFIRDRAKVAKDDELPDCGTCRVRLKKKGVPRWRSSPS